MLARASIYARTCLHLCQHRAINSRNADARRAGRVGHVAVHRKREDRARGKYEHVPAQIATMLAAQYNQQNQVCTTLVLRRGPSGSLYGLVESGVPVRDPLAILRVTCRGTDQDGKEN
eukprot:3816028-Rhodomonas_salina.4